MNSPEDWEEKRLGDLSTLVTSGSRGWSRYYSEVGALFVRIGNLTRDHINLRLDDVVFVQPPRDGEGQRTQLLAGDLLISITADLGIIGVVPAKLGAAYVNQHIALLRIDPSTANSRWLGHFMSSANGRRQVRRLDDAGAKAGLNLPTVKSLLASVPPLPEQRAIAAVLDAIDDSIRKTEQIIAKLRQVKHGLLHDLLTRGIDDNGELRDPERHPEQFQDSPLGRIPKGWEVASIESSCLAIVDCPHTTPIYLDDGVLVARTTQIKAGRFDEVGASRVSSAEYLQRIARMKPRPGDVILTREAPVGEAFVIPDGMRICLGQRVMLLRANQSVLSPHFLVAQVYSGEVARKIERISGGSTNPHVNVSDVRGFQIPRPSRTEQEQISISLRELDCRIDRESTGLSKLRKMKSGLAEDLLTGRVRTTSLGEISA